MGRRFLTAHVSSMVGRCISPLSAFLSDRLLLVLKAQGRLLLGSDLHRFRPALALGLRFNL